MKNKKLCALFLAIIFMLNMSSSISFDVSAEVASHTYTYDSYEVEYAVLNEWEGNQSIKITVRNTGTESILNWAVAYRAGGEINGLWNAVSPKENIIKNAGYNYEIEPDKSVSFGYTLSGENLKIPEKFEIVSKRTSVTEGYEVKFDVYDNWGDGFQGAVTVTNTGSEPLEAWTLSFDANFTIGNSWGGRIIDSAENSYTIASEMWTNPIMPNSSSSFGFTAAKEADTEASADNFVLTSVIIDENAVPENPNEDIDYELDTDKDGLPDYYEEILGTDKNKEDTDGDGLSDGYEVLYLGTDPLKADTDGNGINDGDEDPDKDGLANIKECELGTDPNTADTDGDGLSDGAEANTHGTDPLKYDTDGDNVSDGDEITLGLDPKSLATDGIPDSERTFTQTVSSDSEVLSAVNDDKETTFNVSLEMKAAGVAEKNLSAYKSGYSAVMQNDAVIGIIPQFNYNSSLSVEEVTLKFELDESIINNTIGTYAEKGNEFEGIKRLNIFKYFEDINMLLPVETFHDTEKNVVYATTDCLGTYCLMDMEIWLDSLGISPTPENAEIEASEAMSENSIDSGNFICYNAKEFNSNVNSNGIKDSINVVFIIDTRENKDKLDAVKKEILDVSRAVLKNSPDGRIYIFEQNTDMLSTERYKVYSANGNRFFINYNDLSKALSGIRANHSLERKAILSDSLDGVLSVCDLSRETYVFSIFNQENVKYRSSNGYDILDDVVAKGVDISVIAEIDNSKKYGYAHDMYKKSGGIFISDTDSDYSETALKHIYGKNVSEEEDTGEYNMILATGLSTVKLNAPITEEYAMLAAAGEIDETQPDTDEDGLPDYMEINFKAKNNLDQFMITFTNGIVRLPTYGECIQCKSGLTYVEQGLNRYEGEDIDPCSEVYTRLVLPIKSDPTNEDGDGDKYTDLYDLRPLVRDITQDEIEEINDVINELIKEYITPNPPMYYNGEIITEKNKDNEVTREYFDKYIWPYYESLVANGLTLNKHACLTGWLQEVYGLNGAEQFWHNLDIYPNILYYECANINEVGPKAIKQIVEGNYYEDDITILGTSGQIICSFFSFDVICDIRDLRYDLTHFEFSKEFALQLGCDSLALLPIVGAIKPLSNVGEVDKLINRASTLKTVSEISDNTGTIIKHSDEIGKIYNKNIAKYQKEITEIITKHGDEFAELVYSVPKYSDEIISWCAKYGDEFYEYIKYYLKEHGNIAKIIDFNNTIIKQDITELGDVLRANRLFIAGVEAEGIPEIINTGKRASAYIQKQVLKQPWFSYLNEEQLKAIQGQLSNKNSLIDVTGWTGKLSGDFKGKTTVAEWMAINRYLSNGKDLERISESLINSEKTCDFIVDGLKIEFKGMETPILKSFKNNAIGYAKKCIGSASKNADVLVLDCTANNLKYTIEELTPIYKELQEMFPELSFEIWTIYGDIT